jgi:hypothetical protein
MLVHGNRKRIRSYGQCQRTDSAFETIGKLRRCGTPARVNQGTRRYEDYRSAFVIRKEDVAETAGVPWLAQHLKIPWESAGFRSRQENRNKNKRTKSPVDTGTYYEPWGSTGVPEPQQRIKPIRIAGVDFSRATSRSSKLVSGSMMPTERLNDRAATKNTKHRY